MSALCAAAIVLSGWGRLEACYASRVAVLTAVGTTHRDCAVGTGARLLWDAQQARHTYDAARHACVETLRVFDANATTLAACIAAYAARDAAYVALRSLESVESECRRSWGSDCADPMSAETTEEWYARCFDF